MVIKYSSNTFASNFEERTHLNTVIANVGAVSRLTVQSMYGVYYTMHTLIGNR